MSEVYCSGCGKCGKRKKIFSFIVSIVSLFLISNLNADCTNSGGVTNVNCNETINSDVYSNTSNGVSSSSILNVDVENMHGVHNNNNGSWSFNGLNVITNGGNAYALYAQNGANITVRDNAHISTNGTNAHAVNAEYSNINIGNNARISTYGPDVPPTTHGVSVPQSMSYGVRASYSNVTIGDNALVTTAGIGSYGVATYENSLLIFGDNATITTTGGNPYCGMCGLLYEGWASTAVMISGTSTAGSTVIMGDNANISIQGWGSALNLARSSSAAYIGDNAIITANGNRNSYAVSMTEGGDVVIGNNAAITTTGTTIYYDDSRYNGQPHTIYGSKGARFTVGDNASITAYGYLASAVQFTDANVTIGDNARITTYGEGKNTSPNEGAYGIKMRNGYGTYNANILKVGNNAVITTHGSQATGVQIREKSTGTFGDNLTIITHGNSADALETYDRSNVTVGDNAFIATAGNASHAVRTLPYGTNAGEANTFIGKNSSLYTTGDGSYAVFATGSDSALSTINIAENASIVTKGVGSSAVYSQSGSSINIDKNAEILTSGVSSYGVHANNASVNIDDNVLISTNGTDAYAVYSTNNAGINIGDNTRIFTYGPDFPTQSRNHAVYVSSASNVTFGDNAYIFTSGVGSGGVYTLSATGNTNNHILFGDNATIITTGGNPNCGQCGLTPTTGWWSYGVYLNTKDSDVTFGDNAFISTQGARAFAVASGNTNTAVYFGDNAAIFTDGNNGSAAVYAYSGGKVEVGDNAVIATTGSAVSGTGLNPSHAVWVQGSSGLATNSTFIAGDNVNITTYRYDASGITASSYAFVTLGDNARITTYADGRYTGQSSSNEGGFGIKIRGSLSNLTVGDNALITTYGNQALGVQIRERSSAVFGGNLTILTHGNSATALETYDRSNVTIGDNALIATTGNASHAVRNLVYASTSASYAGNATTIIGKGARLFTQGDDSHAIYSTGDADAISNIILNTDTNISALGNNSYAMYALNANGLITTNSSSKLNILGDMTAKSGGVVDLDLKDGSYFYGDTQIDTTSGINLAFDGSNSIWKLKGNSSLTSLSLTNNAKVDLTNGASYTTLSIDNLAGSGVFYQRIDLDNKGDLIVINNSSSGNHKLIFDDSAFGGYNALGNESFSVVEQNASGTHSAVFTGEAYIGQYRYYIISANNTQYLATESSVIGGGNGSGGSGGGAAPILNPVALASISFANINYISNYANTQTLFQRMGELDTNRDTLDDVWVRVYTGELDSFDEKFNVNDASYHGLQGGFDRIYNMGNGKLFAGFTVGLSKTDIDYKEGDGKVNSYDIGLYASYKDERDFYIDTLLKYTKNENEFDVVTSNGINISADNSVNAYSLSVEGGKRFDVKNGFYIEPQAELTFSRQSSGTSSATSGLVTSFDSYNSILGRVGTIVGYNLKDKAKIYYKIGYIKEFDGDVSYRFNNGAKETYELNGDVFDNAVGVVSTVNKDHHLYFEGTYQIGDSFNNKKANFGYKYSF
jgi:outer membrane autotransporter protein